MNIKDIPVKDTGDFVYPSEFNAITATFRMYETYSEFESSALDHGNSPDNWMAIVIADEKNNAGKLTLYIYTRGVLNWCATTQITL